VAVAEVIGVGAEQLASAVLAVLFWTVIVVIGCCVLVAIAIGTVISVGGRRYDRKHGLRTPTQPSPVIGEVNPEQRADLLAHSCGPCNNIPLTSKCICAGNCGSQRCTGAAVRWDLTAELERVTRGGARG
jgi:hypothetical protein